MSTFRQDGHLNFVKLSSDTSLSLHVVHITIFFAVFFYEKLFKVFKGFLPLAGLNKLFHSPDNALKIGIIVVIESLHGLAWIGRKVAVWQNRPKVGGLLKPNEIRHWRKPFSSGSKGPRVQKEPATKFPMGAL